MAANGTIREPAREILYRTGTRVLSGTMLLDRLLVQLTTEVRNSRDTARSVDPEKSLKILKAKISNDKLAINAIENVLNARNQL
jgi:hypothetical protein